MKRREAGKERKGEEVTLNHTYLDKNKDERASYLEMGLYNLQSPVFVCVCLYVVNGNVF